MTIIAAVKAEDGVWMGGDSGVTDEAGRKDSGIDITCNILVDKVRLETLPNGEELLWGCSGSHFAGQLVEYKHEWSCPNGDALRWLWGEVERMWELWTEPEHVWQRVRDDDYADPTSVVNVHLIFGFRGRLFSMANDGTVDETTDDYLSIGSASSFAMGSLFSSQGESPQVRVTDALEAALHHELSIRKPFSVKFVPISKENNGE